MSTGTDKVKLVHASDLETWTRLPAYGDHDGVTLGEYEARQREVRAVLREHRGLARALDKRAELDVVTPVEYARHEIPVPRSVLSRPVELPLPEPEHPETTITCDIGDVTGQTLRVPASWRQRTATVRYSSPTNVLNAQEIAKLEDRIAVAGDEARARLAKARASRYLEPVLFISHRWNATDHPDPEARQLAKLKALEHCFLIYDYSSFPQDTSAPEDEAALLEILSGMNSLIHRVLVLASPDFLERGWCIYEYTVASMRASIVCDELNDSSFVLLRNLAATRPPNSPRITGSGMESEIQNAKNQQTLETVNTILPLFNRSKFTVERDREIVRGLLVAELARTLPAKKEYMQYLGEWKTTPWTEEELREAFTSELKWPSLQYSPMFKPFEPKVPSTVTEAVANSYELDRMPPQNDLTWLTLLDSKAVGEGMTAFVKGFLVVAAVIVGIAIVALVLLIALVRWLFF